MPSKVGKRRYQRIYNPMGEPGPGTSVAGYARYSSDMQDGITILTQKRKMQALADLKGWLLIRWFEEPAQSAKYEEIAKRPIFAAMLDEAGDVFKAILCYDTSRWARNVEAGMSAINLLRRKQVWWSTYDERHTIDSIQEAGGGLVFGVELHMAQGYVTDLSRRTIDGKEERALAGLHASNAPFGYLPPDYDQRPPLAPANWKPTSKPVRLDPAVRDAFTVIADLTIAGGSAQEIADELTNRGYHPTGRKYSGPVDPRTGTQTSPLQRLFTKDSLQAILMNPFYREFAPDCGKGTITTAQGQAVMGRHDAAWDWETWHRMEAARSLLRRAPNAKRSQRQEYPFAGIIVCSACQYLMRSWHYKRKGQVRQYYTCHSDIKRLPCAARVTTTPAHCVEESFGYLLAHHRLGDSWQEDLIALMDETPVYDHWQDIADQRKVLEQERELYNTMLLHQGITSEVYGQQMQRINATLAQLPTETTPIERQQEALDAGDVLRGLHECWELARANSDMLQLSELVHGLLQPGGLIWDSASRSIRALKPHPEFMPSLALALLPTWIQEGDTLICQELAASLVPEKHVRPQRQRSVQTMRTLSLAAHADEIERMLRLGHSLQQIANKLGVNRMKVWRYVQKRGQKED